CSPSRSWRSSRTFGSSSHHVGGSRPALRLTEAGGRVPRSARNAKDAEGVRKSIGCRRNRGTCFTFAFLAFFADLRFYRASRQRGLRSAKAANDAKGKRQV